jgi:poly(3-hydroxybutyrate) depolymerase
MCSAFQSWFIAQMALIYLMAKMTRRLVFPVILVLAPFDLLTGCKSEVTKDPGAGDGSGGSDTGRDPSSDGGSVTYTGTFSTTAGDQDTVLTLNGVSRDVFLYVPASPGTRPPLLIAFHGTGEGSESGLGREMRSLFQPLADAKGVIVAAPEARAQPEADWDQHVAGQKFWETRAKTDPARGSDPDRNPDLLLVRAIIEEATRVHHIDSKRIYLAGFSNGGFFSLHTAVALRTKVAAFVEMSSGLVRCENTNLCYFAGTGTTCAALRQESGYCTCTGTEKPIALPTSGRIPPGWLTHGNQDWTVSVVYTCDLADRMQALGASATVGIRAGKDHELPDLSTTAAFSPLWSFFDKHPLP